MMPQVDSDRTLREALQEATHDMSRAMAEATEAAEKKIAEAKVRGHSLCMSMTVHTTVITILLAALGRG